MNFQSKTLLMRLSAARVKLWLGCFAACGLLAYYWDATAQAEKPSEMVNVDSAATYIPDGFVLVPIEIANYESLDSILGKMGVVDLFVPALEPGRRPTRVAQRVRILRAPLNPSRFAVLAPEFEAHKLVSHIGPFTVVVQNPERTGTKFGSEPERRTKNTQNPRSKKSSRIVVEIDND